MKGKNIPDALLVLLGELPRRIEMQQTTMMIQANGERITVSSLLNSVLSLLDEAIKGKEEEEFPQ